MNDMELAEEIEDSVKHGDAFWLRFSDDQWQQIIAALRRPDEAEKHFLHGMFAEKLERACSKSATERPPSGEMVEQIVRIVLQLGYNHWLRNGTAIKVEDAQLVLLDVQPALSAAEAAVRKPCPLCGRTDPHSHTSGPLGIS